MPVYVYKAVDSKGKMIKGELEAAGEVEVSTQLAKIGYLPVSIGFKEKKAAPRNAAPLVKDLLLRRFPA